MSDPYHKHDLQAYYSSPGLITDAGEYRALLDGLPDDIGQLCKIVQSLIVHIFWLERYGLNLPDERKTEVGLRMVIRQLRRIMELDARPLSNPRPLEKRLVGNCRDFSVMLTTILRHKGIPVRARCGFGTYFKPDHFEDHWVCEYWNRDQKRWVMVDAQLDALQCERLGIRFDPLDIPPGSFVTGGWAWLNCRAGKENPEKFGIFDMHGMSFILGDLVRDFLSLNKIEILPWDAWGLMVEDDKIETALPLADHIAQIIQTGDEGFDELRRICSTEARLQPPDGWEP